MQLFRFQLLALIVAISSFAIGAEEVRSKELRLDVCDAIGDYLEEAGLESDFNRKECAESGKLLVTKESKAKYDGPAITVTIEGASPFKLKEGDELTVSLSVQAEYKDNVCDVTLNRLLPKLSAIRGEIVLTEPRWSAEAGECRTKSAKSLATAEIGDKNVQYITARSLPKAVKSEMNAYDLVPLIGYDGYYSELENSFAKVVGKDGKAIGYFQLVLYSYSEDPVVHYWLFKYNANGKLIAVPQEKIAELGDDVDVEGSTKEWITTGKLDR